jgi:hypothetical protein
VAVAAVPSLWAAMGAGPDQQGRWALGQKWPKHCSQVSPFFDFLFPIEITENLFKLLKFIKNRINVRKIQNKFPWIPF